MIFATLSRQGINYDPVLKKDPDNFALLNDPSTLRSKEMSTREKVMGEEEDMPSRMFKGKPPKCHNCGVFGHTEK